MQRKPVRTVLTVVEQACDVGGGVRSLVLKDPDGWELPPFKPGAHLDVHLPNGMIRTYSLCGDPGQANRYRLGIKHEPLGRGGSHFLCAALRAGDSLGVSLPRGGLSLGEVSDRHIFVAGGVGVTPFLSALPELQRRGQSFLLHVLSRGRPPFEQELTPLVRRGLVQLHDTSCASRPRIRALLGTPETGVRIACCGPESLLDAFEAESRAWEPSHVHIERFCAPSWQPDPQAQPYTLVLARSGRQADVAADQTVLQALRSMGVEVDASCEGGVCGACRLAWLEGEPLHADRVLSAQDRKRFLMACVAGCAGGRLVLDI